ncbi:lipoprotein insertase outer membrane protein LolB [Undibacterium sp. Di24W]|uniref:lipoprotein insertase outer membrane protein LolB n=1 Tax=Undibacterium sp. Di24W TaxID=3413033 RepID=UPI003BF39D31
MNIALPRPAHRHTNLICGLFILACCTFLSACTSTKSLTPQQAAAPRNLQENLQLNGRISIRYQQDQQDQSVTVNYEWQQTPTELHISLSSSFGQTVANIHQTPISASLEQAKQETRYATDIEQLLIDSLGWSIPINDLKIWLQGFDLQPNKIAVAIPAQDDFQLNSKGWQLRFVKWQEDARQVRPKRIDLEKMTEQFGLVKIGIIIM